MESISACKTVAFGVLQARLIKFINARIQNGDFTERGLARILAVSQPQIHNVLKGARKLQPELADRFMRKFGTTILQLFEDAELNEELLSRSAASAPASGPNAGETAKTDHTLRKPASQATLPSEKEDAS